MTVRQRNISAINCGNLVSASTSKTLLTDMNLSHNICGFLFYRGNVYKLLSGYFVIIN